MACDICLKQGDSMYLNERLNWTFKTMIICDSCSCKANKLLDKYREMAWVRTKKKLKKMYKDARK